MKRSWFILAIAALVLSVVSVTAGESYKCDSSTQDCLDKMAASLQKRGWVGINMEEGKDGRLQVIKVIPDSPAVKAGLKPGDILVAMNGIEFAEENQEAMMKVKKSQHPGSQVTYTIERAGKAREINVELGKVPQDVLAQWIGGHMLQHADVEIAQN